MESQGKGNIRKRLGWLNSRKHSQNDHSVPNKGLFKKIFTCRVDVIMYSRMVKAQIDSGKQNSRIGLDVAKLVLNNSDNKIFKRVVRTAHGLQLKKFLKCRMGTKLSRMRDLECEIDPNLPAKEAVLGMVALKSLNYQFKVGGKDVYQTISEIPIRNPNRKAVQRKDKRIPFLGEEDLRPKSKERPARQMDEDEDVIYGLEDEEARLIEEWENDS